MSNCLNCYVNTWYLSAYANDVQMCNTIYKHHIKYIEEDLSSDCHLLVLKYQLWTNSRDARAPEWNF